MKDNGKTIRLMVRVSLSKMETYTLELSKIINLSKENL